VVDFEDIRPMPMAPRRPLIRRRAAPPPAVPEPPVLHPNRHIYRGHFDAPVLPDFPDLPPPPPEPDFDDGEQHSSSGLRSKRTGVPSVYKYKAGDSSQDLIHQSHIDNFFVEKNFFPYLHERRQS
jgi:hypothetical protein